MFICHFLNTVKIYRKMAHTFSNEHLKVKYFSVTSQKKKKNLMGISKTLLFSLYIPLLDIFFFQSGDIFIVMDKYFLEFFN